MKYVINLIRFIGIDTIGNRIWVIWRHIRRIENNAFSPHAPS